MPRRSGTGFARQRSYRKVLVAPAFLREGILSEIEQTVGKKLLNIRIVRSDGSPASFGRLVGLRRLQLT